jgi:hypothetical protein
VRPKLTISIAVFALLVPAAVAGCGGGDDGGGSGGKLSTTDTLKIAQDRADIDEFCSVSSGSPGSDLYDRAFFSAVDAVDQVVLIYKRSPNAVYHDALKKRDLTMKQVTEDAAKKLKGCGKDGKLQSQKLTQALQSSS